MSLRQHLKPTLMERITDGHVSPEDLVLELERRVLAGALLDEFFACRVELGGQWVVVAEVNAADFDRHLAMCEAEMAVAEADLAFHEEAKAALAPHLATGPKSYEELIAAGVDPVYVEALWQAKIQMEAGG